MLVISDHCAIHIYSLSCSKRNQVVEALKADRPPYPFILGTRPRYCWLCPLMLHSFPPRDN